MFGIHDFANEGFFSLSHTSLEIHCFSYGLILTRFPSNVSIFVMHFIKSPHCLHLYERDPVLPPKNQIPTLRLNDDNYSTNAKTAGFIHIKNPHDDYYKCPSCHGIVQDLQSTENPWITHAKTFPFCPHIIQVKSKHFVKAIFNQDQPHQTQSTMYFRYLQIYNITYHLRHEINSMRWER